MKTVSMVLCGLLLLAAPVTILLAGEDSAGEQERSTLAESPLAAFLPAELEGYEASSVHDDGLGWPQQEAEDEGPSVKVVARTFVKETADDEEITITVSILDSELFRPLFDLMFIAMDVDVDKPDKVVRTIDLKGQPARLVIKRQEDGTVEKVVLVTDVRPDLMVAIKAEGPATTDDVVALAEKIDFTGLVASAE